MHHLQHLFHDCNQASPLKMLKYPFNGKHSVFFPTLRSLMRFPLFSHPFMSSFLSAPASASQKVIQRTWSRFFTSPWGRSLTYVLWLRCTRMTMTAISCCHTTDWPAIYTSEESLELDSSHPCLDWKQKRILLILLKFWSFFILLGQHA